jgi:hypothetical protein
MNLIHSIRSATDRSTCVSATACILDVLLQPHIFKLSWFLLCTEPMLVYVRRSIACDFRPVCAFCAAGLDRYATAFHTVNIDVARSSSALLGPVDTVLLAHSLQNYFYVVHNC